MKIKVYEMLKIATSQLIRDNQKIYNQEKQIIREVMEAIENDKCVFDTIDKIIESGAKLKAMEKAKNANNEKREKLIKAA